MRVAGDEIAGATRKVQPGQSPRCVATVTAPPDQAVAPWVALDPRPLPFAEGVGLRWQLEDNRHRFVERWAAVLR